MYKNFLDNHRNGILILDKDFRVHYSNKALRKIFKKDSQERCGEFLECFYQSTEKKRCLETSRCNGCDIRRNIRKILDGELEQIYIENVMYEALLLKEKKEVYLSMEIKRLIEANNIFVTIEFLKVKVNEEMVISDKRVMHDMLDNMGDFIFYKDSELRYVYANKSFCDFIGIKKINLIGKKDSDFFPEHMSKEWEKTDRYVLEKGSYIEEEKINDRYYKVSKEKIRIDKEDILACVVKDITDEKNEMKKAYVDKLTGVGNRYGYDEEIRKLFQKKDKDYDLALLDLDYLRDLNNNYGHSLGDKVLRYVAKTIKKEGISKVYRIGGDEFAILIEDDKDSLEICKKINDKIKESLIDNKKISTSIGVVNLKYNESILANFNYADTALYESKKKGRGTVTKVKR
ncbi:diguanylate cyclase [Cetobacterium sp.]|uniref:diguanylate cyclase n=2 Tax=Cetobacterium sp. TaxID=2071632 RepID=UPI002FCA20F3